MSIKKHRGNGTPPKSQDSGRSSHFHHGPTIGYIGHTRIENQPNHLEATGAPTPART